MLKFLRRVLMRSETKEMRFKRIAEKRVQRVLDSLKLLSQLSNKRMYEWNERQLKQIWNAVDRELKQTRESFENAKQEEFKL